MTSQELMTLVADRIPVKIALLDNKKLGMIRQWQEIIYAGNYHSSHLPGPGLRQARRGLRRPGLQGDARPRRSTGAIRAAQAVDGPALIWFEIAEEQNVFPMMPAGKGLSDLIETWGAPRNERRPERQRPHRPAPAATPTDARRRRARCPARASAAATSSWSSSWTGPGVLNRVASLMRARNFNIDSLAVSPDRQASTSAA